MFIIFHCSTTTCSQISVASGKCLDVYESIISGKSIVINTIQPAKESQQWNFGSNGQITNGKYPNMCLDIKGASESAGTAIILWNCKSTVSNVDAVNQQFDIITKNKQNIINLDEYTTSSKMGGWNQSVALTPPANHPKQTKIFFKPLKNEKAILLEVAGSRMACYITNGLVLLSKRASYKNVQGIYQDFCQMNEKPFRELKVDKNFIVDLSFLNTTQLHQLFTHMVADRLISNWDTHNQVCIY